ncbi:MAG: addiction module protein [Gammaproteobacteria bacterium]|nr:addiction module protein [Gammaproteobacteria bacterium]
MAKLILEKLFSEALALSDRERAELAHLLVMSLDGGPDQDAEREWEREMLRRLDRIDAGAAEFIETDEFQRRMQACQRA